MSTSASVSLSQAVTDVVADWERRGAFSIFTIGKYGPLLNRFTKFAKVHHVVALADVDEPLVRAFVTSAGRDRQGNVVRKVANTAHTDRLSALRAFYASAPHLGFQVADPTVYLEMEPREKRVRPTARSLSDEEADRLRFLVGNNPTRQRPAAVSLALLGAWATELSSLTAASFSPDHKSMFLPGVQGRRARTIALDEPTARMVASRFSWLRGQVSAPDPYLLSHSDLPTQRQAKTFMAIRAALIRIGLGDDPTATPASLTLWAAQHAFDTTGRIEDAARLVGFISLDAAAAALGWNWDIG